ncbi:MAG: DinB family protein [archaeon]
MLDYKEMFDYFKKERAKLIEVLEKLSNETFTENRGLSFDSMKNVFVHTVMLEDSWLHYRAAGLLSTGLKHEDFQDLKVIRRYIEKVDAKTALLFDRMTDRDLSREVRRPRPDGGENVYTLEQVLYHIPIEIIHHYGEVFAELWKMDLETPYYSYLEYSKNRTDVKKQ